MSRRDEFITVIRALRAASPTITDKQHIGLLRQAVQQYGLSLENAKQILKDSGLVIGESVNYFEVLGISVEDIQSLTESVIATRVDTAHKKAYRASLNAGGRIRPDGKTEEQWRTILNQARDTLKDPQKRRTHLATLETEILLRTESISTPEPTASDTSVHDEMALIPAGEFQMGSNDNNTDAHEKPVHTVYIDAFYMDRYPVTNAQYKKFVDANPQWGKPQWFKNRISRRYHDGEYLRHWTENDYPDGKADYPVKLGELVCGNGIRTVGRQAFADRGRMGESGAWRVGRSKISVGEFNRCKQGKLW